MLLSCAAELIPGVKAKMQTIAVTPSHRRRFTTFSPK
jgi:hypothetical protein